MLIAQQDPSLFPADINVVVTTLNEALLADYGAISQLFSHRFLCNEDLADHPTIQVAENDSGETTVGSLGLINGIVERLTGRRVAAVYEEVMGHDKLVAFQVYVPAVTS